MTVRWAILFGASALLAACGSEADGGGKANRDAETPPGETPPGETPGDDPAETAKKIAERPWEVISRRGETYLPNVFYADAAENEQIMPYALDGHVMIDRLVYPTLGNPNLFTKGDPQDELVVVLRVEDAAMAHLAPTIEPVAGSHLSRLVVPNDPATGFAFFLVPRSAREPNTASTKAISSGQGTEVVRVYPNEILVSPEPADMPAVLKKRRTLRFVFRQGAMGRAPSGLYDLRFEVRKDNALHRTAPGAPALYEYQYNAVRVFDDEPDEYPIVNVTDTQVSVSGEFNGRTLYKLDEFVQFMNTTSDPSVRDARFITFNGDLHNGGSPITMRQKAVAWTYADEAKAIVNRLKYLPTPIFLTVGNHDGYVATGHVPSAVRALDTAIGTSLPEVMLAASPRGWPDFSLSDWQWYIDETAGLDRLGGHHRDIFTGGFSRTSKLDGFAGWRELPRAKRNYVVYDGFYQWQKTYGPLHYSHTFGKTRYVSLNSYELRQHRRSGWGMYTVNYGGGMSEVQMDWLDRELLRAETGGDDVVILAHHDPRGGHQGKDHGYYFEQLEYGGVMQSTINYLVSEVWNPAVCKLPGWALPREKTESCTHDGLQEWMRPDPELDCDWSDRGADFTCTPSAPRFASGIELMKRLAASPSVRTLLLGHTHYNELEVLQEGDELVPGKFPVGPGAAQKFATLEVLNPLRGFSTQRHDARARGVFTELADYDHQALGIGTLERSFAAFVDDYERSVAGWDRTLAGAKTLSDRGPRDLVVLRLVSNADLTKQTYANGKGALGFSVLHLSRRDDARGVPLAQINRASFFANVGAAAYDHVGTIDLDRTKKLRPRDPSNPVEQIYDW